MELVEPVEFHDFSSSQKEAIKSIATRSDKTPYCVYQSINEIPYGLQILGYMTTFYDQRNIGDHVSVDTISHVQLISTLLQNTLIRASLYRKYDEGKKWTDAVTISKTVGQELFTVSESGFQLTHKGIDAIRYMNRHFKFMRLTNVGSKSKVGIKFTSQFARFAQRDIYSERTEGLLGRIGGALRNSFIGLSGVLANKRMELSRSLIKEEVREKIVETLRLRFQPLILQKLFEGKNWLSLNASPLLISYSDFNSDIPALVNVGDIGGYVCRSFGVRYLSDIGLSTEFINNRGFLKLKDPFLFARAVGAFGIECGKWDTLQVRISRKLLEKTSGIPVSTRLLDNLEIFEFEPILQEVLNKVPNNPILILLVATYGAACDRRLYRFVGERLIYLKSPAYEHDRLERELASLN
jgi:hypothetical protein